MYKEYKKDNVFMSIKISGFIDVEDDVPLCNTDYANIELRFKYESGKNLKCFRLMKCKFAFASLIKGEVVKFGIGQVESITLMFLIINLNNSLYSNKFIEDDITALVDKLRYLLSC